MWKLIKWMVQWLVSWTKKLPEIKPWIYGAEKPELPEGTTWGKTPKPLKGWVNFHIRQSAMEALGETSVKRGQAPAAIVNALFEMYARWSEEEKRAFVWEYLLSGTPVNNEESALVPPIVYLSTDGLTTEKPEDAPTKGTPKVIKKAKLKVEQMEELVLPAASLAPLAPTATLSAGVLTVNGTDGDDSISVADANKDGAVEITVNAQLVTPPTGPALLTQFNQIVINGFDGDDLIRTDATLDTLNAAGARTASPNVSIFAGAGDDDASIGNGGAAAGIQLINGVLVGPFVGGEFIDGGPGNDVLTDGPANGGVFLGRNGKDLYIWPPGTLNAVVDLGGGFDTVRIVGNDGADDAFSLTQSAGRAFFQRTNLVNFTVDANNVERFELNPGSGNDSVSVGVLNGSGVKEVAIDGGAGADAITVASQNGLKVFVAPDALDIVMLDALFASMGKK